MRALLTISLAVAISAAQASFGQSSVNVSNLVDVGITSFITNTIAVSPIINIDAVVSQITNGTTVQTIMVQDKLYIGTLGDWLQADGTNLFYYNSTGGVEQVTGM